MPRHDLLSGPISRFCLRKELAVCCVARFAMCSKIVRRTFQIAMKIYVALGVIQKYRWKILSSALQNTVLYISCVLLRVRLLRSKTRDPHPHLTLLRRPRRPPSFSLHFYRLDVFIHSIVRFSLLDSGKRKNLCLKKCRRHRRRSICKCSIHLFNGWWWSLQRSLLCAPTLPTYIYIAEDRSVLSKMLGLSLLRYAIYFARALATKWRW